MVEAFNLPLGEARPTQLYISARKLADLEALYPPGSEARMEPVPVARLKGAVAFTDGHTRAFLAWKRGLDSVPAYWDDSDLDVPVYLSCLGWCEDEGIRTIADLAGRVVDEDAYKAKWIARCEAIDGAKKEG
ncbi:MAG: hypothetical protein JW839_23115 [Candidatus Lokiarchaeota archaeon]|nr:hypothetical protein [Candidatus Lokiarchaeota archaeon]